MCTDRILCGLNFPAVPKQKDPDFLISLSRSRAEGEGGVKLKMLAIKPQEMEPDSLLHWIILICLYLSL